MSESDRLSDQIRRAFEGEAWHGDALLEILADVDATTAAAHPIDGAHSIWELVLHIRAWDNIIVRRMNGEAAEPDEDENFPPVSDTSDAAWKAEMQRLRQTHEELVNAVAKFSEARLDDPVPGKGEAHHNFYYAISGIVQHELYHAGQIALLKKFR